MAKGKPLRQTKPAKSNGKHPGGRPQWEPTKEERLLVEVATGGGFTQPQIATLLGVSEDSLQRYCRRELDIGALKAGAKISGALFTKAMKGDVAAIVWWEKTRRGLSDRIRHEHLDLSRLTDEELEFLERISSRASKP